MQTSLEAQWAKCSALVTFVKQDRQNVEEWAMFTQTQVAMEVK